MPILSKIKNLGIVFANKLYVILPMDVMPLSKAAIDKLLSDMQAVKNKGKASAFGHNTATRSGELPGVLEDFGIDQLKKGITSPMQKKVEIERGKDVYLTRKTKNMDCGVYLERGGPSMLISVKSPMTSIDKNVGSRFEEALGDVFTLHEKYPFCVFGFVMTLPMVDHAKKADGTEAGNSINFLKLERFLTTITNRTDTDKDYMKYEHLAFVVVDWDSTPPKIVDSYPKNKDLSIWQFFDKMIATANERSPSHPFSELGIHVGGMDAFGRSCNIQIDPKKFA